MIDRRHLASLEADLAILYRDAEAKVAELEHARAVVDRLRAELDGVAAVARPSRRRAPGSRTRPGVPGGLAVIAAVIGIACALAEGATGVRAPLPSAAARSEHASRERVIIDEQSTSRRDDRPRPCTVLGLCP